MRARGRDNPGPLTMILFVGVIVLALLAGFAVGGRIQGFVHLRLRWWLLAPLGLALQGVPLPDARHGADLAIRVAVLGTSYALVFAFAVRNLRIAGVPLLAIGLVLNGLVVTVNGGMPVSRHALVASGQADVLALLVRDEGAKHHLLTPDDRMTFLGDVIPIGAPIEQVVSVGDLFVYAGIAWLIVAVMRGRTEGLDRPTDPEHYRGRHRRAPPEVPERAPAAAKTSGSER